jgi:hypothetical protein
MAQANHHLITGKFQGSPGTRVFRDCRPKRQVSIFSPRNTLWIPVGNHGLQFKRAAEIGCGAWIIRARSLRANLLVVPIKEFFFAVLTFLRRRYGFHLDQLVFVKDKVNFFTLIFLGFRHMYELELTGFTVEIIGAGDRKFPSGNGIGGVFFFKSLKTLFVLFDLVCHGLAHAKRAVLRLKGQDKKEATQNEKCFHDEYFLMS